MKNKEWFKFDSVLSKETFEELLSYCKKHNITQVFYTSDCFATESDKAIGMLARLEFFTTKDNMDILMKSFPAVLTQKKQVL